MGNRLSRQPRLALSPTRKEGPLLAKKKSRLGNVQAETLPVPLSLYMHVLPAPPLRRETPNGASP